MSDHDRDEEIRRLLADARVEEPMPASVAARIDAALADLDPPGAPAEEAVDLASVRRRRTARNLLVAAAAVVVVGVGLSRVDLATTGSSENSAGSGAANSSASHPHRIADGASAADSDAGSAADAPESGPTLSSGVGPVRLRADRFGQQVRRLEPTGSGLQLPGTSAAPQSPGGTAGTRNEYDAAVGTCDSSAWGAGERVAVRYTGRAGVLIYRPVDGSTRVVDLYLCGHDQPTRSITLSER